MVSTVENFVVVVVTVNYCIVDWRLPSLTIRNIVSYYPTKMSHGIVFRRAKLSQNILTIWLHPCWLKSYNPINHVELSISHINTI